METKILSKSEFNSMASKLISHSEQLKTVSSELKSILSGIENYEDINVSGIGSVLASNIDSISNEMDAISHSIQNYIMDIEEFDKYDFDVDAVFDENSGMADSAVNDFRGPVSPTGSSASNETVQSSESVEKMNGSNQSNSRPVSPKPVQPTYSPVQGNGVSDSMVNTDNNIINEDINNNVDSSNVAVDNMSGIDSSPSDKNNIQYTDSANNNIGGSNVGVGNVSEIDNSVVDDNNFEEQIEMDIFDDEFSDDVYVSDQSGYIGQTNNNISHDVISDNNINNNGRNIGGIIGGLGAAAVVGLGAVGGAKIIKNMKENQEIDDDEE